MNMTLSQEANVGKKGNSVWPVLHCTPNSLTENRKHDMQLDDQERIFSLLIPTVYSIFKQERGVISNQPNRHE